MLLMQVAPSCVRNIAVMEKVWKYVIAELPFDFTITCCNKLYHLDKGNKFDRTK